ncbi:hypothetical protein [uncultured Oceanicoccus sp.]|uniref:DUF6450 domain-containing protein n=1 Tax=uncultured Oceanicoccus sp. TaxID=1706381 RepID=UPI0030D93257
MAEQQRPAEQEEDQQQNDHGWLGDLVRLGILAWSMAILTANYLGIFKQAVDPTFPASLLTGTAATYTPALGKLNKKKKEGTGVNVVENNSKTGIK